MKPSKGTIILMIVLILVAVFMVNFVTSKLTNKGLISSNLTQLENKAVPSAIPADVTPFNTYNPPKEFKYDKNTDLNEELQSINPKILDDDFDSLNSLKKVQ